MIAVNDESLLIIEAFKVFTPARRFHGPGRGIPMGRKMAGGNLQGVFRPMEDPSGRRNEPELPGPESPRPESPGPELHDLKTSPGDQAARHPSHNSPGSDWFSAHFSRCPDDCLEKGPQIIIAGLDQDLPELALHFLSHFAAKNSRDVKGFTPDAMDAMIRYPWPGNVRELMNSVERGVVLSRSDYLSLVDLPFIRQDQELKAGGAGKSQGYDPVDRPLAEIEQEAVLKTLASADNNRSEAARRLGITRKTLLKKLRLYGKA